MLSPLNCLKSGVAPSLIFALVLAAVSPAAVQAQDEESAASTFAGLVGLCDADGDKVVTLAEFSKVVMAYREAMDTVTDVDEAMELEQKFSALVTMETYLMADKNDDHKLTADEFSLYWDRTFTMHAQGPPRLTDADDKALAEFETAMIWRQLKAFDADNNGSISKAEMTAYILSMIKKQRAMEESDPRTPRVVEPEGPIEEPGDDGDE